MKQLVLLWLLCCLVFFTNAQTITITDVETGEPIELATLYSNDPQASAIVNAEGQTDVSAFVGADRIMIRALGYKTVEISYEELKSASFALSLEVTNLSLDETVISASRWRQSSDEVPTKIISISGKDVALQNPQTAADLLGISGKVYIQKSQQGGGSPMIRGFATNRLLYTVDGVRMNTAIFRGGNIQNVMSLDPFAIEHTEVLFGLGSVIYGSDAIGGVMSYQTLTPQLSLKKSPLITGKAVLRTSSANRERTGHFHVNAGWKKWAFVTSVSSNDFDHLRQGRHGPDDYLKTYHVERIDTADVVIAQNDPLLQVPSAYSQINLMQKVRFKPNEQWDFQYGFHYSESSPYGRYDRHNRMRNGLPQYGEWNYGPQKWMMNNLGITHSAKDGIYDQVTLRLAQQSFRESRIDRSFNSDLRAIREEEVEAYSVNLDFNKALGRHHVFYGAEYVLNDVTSIGTDENIVTGIRVEGPARYPRSTWQSLAVYVNDEFRLTDKLTLQGGFRYNRYSLHSEFDTTFYPFPFTDADINNGALTGSLGAVLRPNDQWVFSTNLSTGFRSPNVDDLGKVFDSEPGAVIVPNPDLVAEYAYNVDLGVAKVFDDFLKMDLTGYCTILQNAMVRRDYTLNGRDSIVYDGVLSRVQAIRNAAVAHVYGVQAGLEVKLGDGFSFSSDFNYQVGEEELNDGTVSPSRHAAPWFGVSRLTFSTQKLHLQVYMDYQGTRVHSDLAVEERSKTEIYALDDDGNTYSPGWYTLNFKGNYRFSENLTIAAGVENITDQRYRSYGSGISGPGRNFVLSFTAGF